MKRARAFGGTRPYSFRIFCSLRKTIDMSSLLINDSAFQKSRNHNEINKASPECLDSDGKCVILNTCLCMQSNNGMLFMELYS